MSGRLYHRNLAQSAPSCSRRSFARPSWAGNLPPSKARSPIGFPPPVRAKGVGAGFASPLPEAGGGADAGAFGFDVGEGVAVAGLGVALGAGVGEGVGVGASYAGSHAWFWAGRSGLPLSARTRLSEPSGDIVNSAPSWPPPLYTAILEPSGDHDALKFLGGLGENTGRKFTSVLKSDPSTLTTLTEPEPDMSSFVPSGDHAALYSGQPPSV